MNSIQQKKALLGALPLLAQAMGRKFGVKIEIGGNSAETDGKTIRLPSLPIEDDDFGALLEGYLDHECGHVRATDFDAFNTAQTPLDSRLLNTLEDVRIEGIMGHIFPGCRSNLAVLVKKLVLRGKFQTVDETNPGQLVGGYLLYTLRSRVLGQTGLDELAQDAATKLDAVYPGLRTELDLAVSDITAAQSTEDCHKITLEVIEAMKRYIKEPPKPPEPPKQEQQDENQPQEGQEQSEDAGGGGSNDDEQSKDQGQASQDEEQGDDQNQNQDQNPQGGDTDEEDGEGDGQDQDQASQGEEQGDGQDQPQDQNPQGGDTGEEDGQGQQDNNQNSGDSAGASGAGWDKEQAKTLAQAFSADESDLIQNLGEMLKDQLEEAAEEAIVRQRREGICGSCEPCEDAATHHLDEQRVKKVTNALRVRLGSLLQATIPTRRLPRRLGRRLDTKKIVRLCAGVDQKVFRGRDQKKGVNTAVHILLDHSISMDGAQMTMANDCMLAVKLALEGQKRVNLGISAFPAPKGGYIPLVRHGERVHSSKIGVKADGGTPLSEALFGVASQMLPLKEERKIILVLTDGQPNSPELVHKTIRSLERLGFELVGVGIQHPDVRNHFKNHCVVHSIAELPSALFGQLEKLLT